MEDNKFMPSEEELSMFDSPAAQFSEEELSTFDEGKKEETGLAGAFGAGIAQGATFSFGDELYGMFNSIGKMMSGESDPRKVKEAYTKARDIARDYVKRSREEHPVASTVGTIAGGLAVPVPGAGVKSALGVGRVGAGVVRGMGSGALYGAGEAEGGAAETLKEAAKGAAMGGVLGGVLTKAGQVATKSATRLGAKKYSNKFYEDVYDALPFDKKTVQQYVVKEGVPKSQLGKLAHDYNINVFKDPEFQWEAAKKMRKDIGSKLNSFLNYADDLNGGQSVFVDDVITAVKKARENTLASGIEADAGTIARWFDKEIKGLTDKYSPVSNRMTFLETNNLISRIDDQVTGWLKPTAKSSRLIDIRREIKDIMDSELKEVKTITGKNMYDLVQPIKKEYHNAMAVHNAVLDNTTREAMPSKFRPALMTGTITKQLMEGVRGIKFLGIGSMVNWFTKNADRFSAAKNYKTAKLFRSVSKRLPKMSTEQRTQIAEAAKRGEKALIATLYVLSQTDPSFREKESEE